MSDVWKARKCIAGVVEGLERSDRTQDVRGAHQQRLRILRQVGMHSFGTHTAFPKPLRIPDC